MPHALQHWLKLLRPAHWIKNLVCLAGVFFYSAWDQVGSALLVALAFCLISSAIYIVNDLFDVDRDRQHPKKKSRPIAAGQISTRSAALGALLLAGCALILAFTLKTSAGFCALAYLVINLAYSFKLKHLPVIDAFCIASGFILRLLAGLYVLDLLPSPWLALFTFSLSLFLGFAKRRAELVALEEPVEIAQRRPVLDHYSLSFLDGALDISAALAMISYALMLLLPGTKFYHPTQVLTVPFIVFMILHYRRRLTHPRYRIEPNRIIYHDRVMQGCTLLWLLTYWIIQYTGVQWFG